MYTNTLGIFGIAIPGISDVIGFVGGQFSGGKVSKTEAIQGNHCPGPYDVLQVKSALDRSSATVRSQARAIVLGDKGFKNELPGLSASNTLIIARCLVWWAHGREDCKIGGDEAKPIAFLTSLMARMGAAPPEPPPQVYTPPVRVPATLAPVAAAAPALGGISMNTALLVGGGLLAAMMLGGGGSRRRR